MKRNHWILLVSFLLFLITSLFALSIGRVPITINQIINALFNERTIDQGYLNVIFLIRGPRIIGGALVGAALSLSGAVYQSALKNPLASQDLLGVSAGSTVGAALAIILNLEKWYILSLSFIFGVVAVVLAVTLSWCFKSRKAISLVLSGIIISGIFNSLQGLLKYIADPDNQLAAITFWSLGSLSGVSNGSIKYVVLPIVVSITAIMLLRWRLNILYCEDVLCRKDQIARNLLILFSTLLTSCAVSISGTINWVGLVIPHIARALVGSDNRYLLPLSTLLGGTFLISIDTIARSLTGVEIPLSILTGTVGAPFFIYIVTKQKTRLLSE